MAESNDYRQILTDKLIEQLEAGTAPWLKPWDAREGGERLPYNPTTDKAYRGANSLYLTAVSMGKGYTDPRWATYKQAAEKGWQVRKGEKGSLVEYWKFSDSQPEIDASGKPVIGEDGLPKTVQVMLEKPRVFRAVVFNAQQMDNVPELSKAPRMYEWEPFERAEKIINSSGAKVFHDQNNRAFYSPKNDEIHLPERNQFHNQAGYYSTALHELGHWTGHESRLNRELGGFFGSAEYAKEELRAELASYFMADKLGVPHEPGRHASYVKSWVKALQDDKNEIFRAARDAEKITEYVLALDLQRERGKDLGREMDGGRGVVDSAQGLRYHFFPGEHTVDYQSLLWATQKKIKTDGEHEQLLVEARRQLGEGVKIGDFKHHIFGGFADGKNQVVEGRVIAETTNCFAINASENEVRIFQKLSFRELPSIGQTVKIELTPNLKHSIRLTGLENQLSAERTVRSNGKDAVPSKQEEAAKSVGRTELAVPFKEKEAAKAVGAKWDKESKVWFAPEGTDLAPLSKWLSKPGPERQSAPENALDDPRFREQMQSLKDVTASLNGVESSPVRFSTDPKPQGLEDKPSPERQSAPENALDDPRFREQMQSLKDVTASLNGVESSPVRFSTDPKPQGLEEKTWLAVPYPEKDKARAAGAKWDTEAKAWFAPAGVELDQLAKWVPKREVVQSAELKQNLDPKIEFAKALKSAGLVIEGEPIMNGKLHRVPVKDGKMKDGAYVGYMDGRPSGYIQNFRTGLTENWTSSGVQLTAEEQAQLAVQSQLAKQQRAAELSEQHGKAAEKSLAKWERLPDVPANGENAYLARKGVQKHGVRFDGERLVVPVRDVDGKLWSLQSINPEEGAAKMFEKGGRKTGNMHVMGELKPGAEILVAEGYATGASLREATGKTVAVAFDSGNLDAVVGAIKQRYPTSQIYIMGDNDKHSQQNVGVEKALAAAKKHQVGVGFPEFQSTTKLTDFNDLHAKEGLGTVKAQVDKALGMSMQESREQAYAIAKQQLGSDVEIKNPGPHTRHTGEVIGVTGYHATQSTGRNAAVVHAVADLDQRPTPGRVATIQYAEGKGVVRERSSERAKEHQVER